MPSFRSAAVALVCALATVVSASSAVAAVPPPPVSPVPQPAAVDVNMTYQGQTACDLTTKPGVADFATLMSRHYSRSDYHTVRPCLGDTSEHYDGRALDWMLDASDPADKAIADAVTRWLTATDSNGNVAAAARRFGIMYIIWNRKVWKSYRDSDTWTDYTGPVPHIDHIHFSFAWDGACERTSWWTGKALTSVSAATCRTSAPHLSVATEFTKYKSTLLKIGSTGDAVRLAQANLPGVTVDGSFGPKTAAAVRAFQTKFKLDVTGRVNKGVWNQMERLQYPLIKYRTTTVLRQGMTGQAVKDAQRALRLKQDGVFGPATEAAVERVQGKYRLAQTGVVRALTWAALDEELRSRMRLSQLLRELPAAGEVAARAEVAAAG